MLYTLKNPIEENRSKLEMNFLTSSNIHLAVLCCSLEDFWLGENSPYKLIASRGNHYTGRLNFSSLEKSIKDSSVQSLGGLNVKKLQDLVKSIRLGTCKDLIVLAVDTYERVIGMICAKSVQDEEDGSVKVIELGSFWVDLGGNENAGIESFRKRKISEELYEMISQIRISDPVIMVTQGLESEKPNFPVLALAAKFGHVIVNSDNGIVFKLKKEYDENNKVYFLKVPFDTGKIENYQSYLPSKYQPATTETFGEIYMAPGDYIILLESHYDILFQLKEMWHCQ